MWSMDDVEAIKLLKYRYLRALDTKDWEVFEGTLTEDVTGDYGSSLAFTNRGELVDFMRTSVGPAVITEHRVDHPEIDVEGDEATGRWYLQDRVMVPDFKFMLFGAAFYSDRYRKTDAGWRICATGYDRTYEAKLSLDDLPSFALDVGPAIRI
ncbi:Bile acid 7-alpha dehydratase [Gordonia insulae]|uniref:Bile acid 7-alpha dehydratase n=2 Tax=Gordonia insulae TaxID=2420509 RepID=A0A3G8JRG6_9ACTN|nr:Bile acid 7-alpha dehydratase [Gordonia insulae]